MTFLLQEFRYPGTAFLTLSALNTAVKAAIETAFPETVWVVAEISEIRCNVRGHCYLELVERDGEKTRAHSRANIWAHSFKIIAPRFEEATGSSLGQGMKVLLQVSVTFHEVYGMSLNIRDIDPTYSLGEMAKRKKEIIGRLTKEGLLHLNKAVPIPVVPQRIAVISSATAAGYGDFIHHIDNNPFGYKIFHELYHAAMQGQDAEASVISALRALRRQKGLYDAVVIVRGGGSQTDLSCFDAYGLAAEVAKFPLPVLTGIGHERDDTVVDIVAHMRLKTPTAVAEFLLSLINSFEERLLNAEKRLIHMIRECLMQEDHRFQYLVQHFRHIAGAGFGREIKRIETMVQKLMHGAAQSIQMNNNRIALDCANLKSGLSMLIREEENRVKHCEQAIRLLNPANILKRGYSITYFRDKAVRDSAMLEKGNIIKTRVYKGSIRSRVEAFHVEE
jgi:exodeoxyribonuclease VII large subunit